MDSNSGTCPLLSFIVDEPLSTNFSERLSLNPPLSSTVFPSENIFQISQCLDTEAALPTPVATSRPPTDIPSSVEWHSENLRNFLDLTHCPRLGDYVPLPIDDEAARMISFDETLVVSRKVAVPPSHQPMKYGNDAHNLLDVDELEPMGGMAIKIESIRDQFLVNVASQFSFDNGQSSSTSISGTYTNDIQLVQEKRFETLFSDKTRHEKRIETNVNTHKALVEMYVADKDYQHCHERRGKLEQEKAPNLLLEGGHFLLMRYIVQQKFVGSIDLLSIDITGEIYRSTISSSHKSKITVNGKVVDVFKVRRVLTRENYIPDISIAVFLESGHLIRQTWQNCPYVVHINPGQNVVALLAMRQPKHPLDDRWRDDTMLLAQYMDMRNDRRVDLRQFVRESPKLTSVIRDYLYCLLLDKPADVIAFTAKYFTDQEFERFYKVVPDQDCGELYQVC